jgi:ABC-type oligopeptide transport system substrate-binding subunit
MTLRIKVPVAITALAAAMAISNIGCTNNPYPAGESKRNVHYLNFGEDPKSLDPTFSFTTVESNVLDVITPSYFRYHYLQQNPVRLVLNLGTKEPTRTRTPDGGEVWTFTVRKDLRFSNDVCFPDAKGRAITAADFIYSWKRMADPKIGYPLTGVFEDNVIGWKEYAAAFNLAAG